MSRASEGYSKYAHGVRVAYTLSRDTTNNCTTPVSALPSACDQDGHAGVQTPGAVGPSQAIPVRLVTVPRARAFQRMPFKAGEA